MWSQEMLTPLTSSKGVSVSMCSADLNSLIGSTVVTRPSRQVHPTVKNTINSVIVAQPPRENWKNSYPRRGVCCVKGAGNCPLFFHVYRHLKKWIIFSPLVADNWTIFLDIARQGPIGKWIIYGSIILKCFKYEYERSFMYILWTRLSLWQWWFLHVMWMCGMHLRIFRLLVRLRYGNGYLSLNAWFDLTRLDGALDWFFGGLDGDFCIHITLIWVQFQVHTPRHDEEHEASECHQQPHWLDIVHGDYRFLKGMGLPCWSWIAENSSSL